jgi:NAD(P)-dependent dehydrogenase (short-subunit alcohol dehydrogenase family)
VTENIKDKVIVITGASSGWGEAAARQLVRYGAKLVLGARRLERLQALAQELSPGSVSVAQTDVTQRDQVKRLVDETVTAHGRIDVIVSNAGLMPQSLLEHGKVDGGIVDPIDVSRQVPGKPVSPSHDRCRRQRCDPQDHAARDRCAYKTSKGDLNDVR